MTETLLAMLDVSNPEAAADLKEALLAAQGFRISTNGSARCDILFLEIGHDLDEEFRRIELIRASGLSKEILLTSARKDPELLLKALKAGVKGFFPQPVNKEDVRAALQKIRSDIEARGRVQRPEKKGHLIRVVGSKGGVGATTVSVNLAVALKETAGNKSVALMDMTPFWGNIDLFLDVKTSFSWSDAAGDIERMDSTYLLNTLSRHESGIHVLPAPSSFSGLEAATPETMERLLGRMRSAFDIVVMDGPTALDDLSVRMLALADTILVVTELNLASLISAKRYLAVLQGLGLSQKEIKLVINRHQKKNTISAGEAEETLGRRIAASIPNDYETVMSAINTGKSLSGSAWQSPVARKFRELAEGLLQKESASENPPGFPQELLGRTWKAISAATWQSEAVHRFKVRAGLAPRR